MKPISLETGSRFGRLIVVVMTHSLRGNSRYLCRCDCGTERAVRSGLLIRGKVRSCGCLVKENKGVTKHGKSRTPTYRSWVQMKNRCLNQRHRHYADYGGRGIRVCEEWLSFDGFWRDMGERPTGKTLDRYPDNNGNYEPGNCRWATHKEQQSNTRANQFVTIDGDTKTIAEWAETLKAPRSRIVYCLRSGIDIKSFCAGKPNTHLRHRLVKIA